MNIVPWLFLLIVVGGGAVLLLRSYKAAGKRAAESAALGPVIGTLYIPGGVLRLTEGELIDGYGDDARRYPLPGLTASVEDSGTVNRRITATRVVTMGPFAAAAPKKLDDREVYVSIQGPGVAIVKAVPLKSDPNAGARAREFVMVLNQRAQELAQA